MKLTRSQLRRHIREELLQEGTLFITHGDYGYVGVEDDAGNEYTVGEIVAELLDAGAAEEIFDAHDSVLALEKLQAKREQPGAAGPMESWDSDVFDMYYDVDRERAVRVWAVMNGFKIEEHEGPEGYGDEGDWRQDEYPEQAQASREAAWEERNYS